MKTKLSIIIMSLALAGTSGAQSINVTPTGVGIGTATPVEKLDVAGNINATGSIAATGDITTDGKVIATGDITATKNINVAGQLTTTGNVGIGTTTPAVKLDIAQNGALKIGQAYLSSGGDYAHLANNEWYDGSAWRTTNTPGALLQLTGQDVNFYTHDGKGQHTSRLRIQGNGNVTVPGSLVVNGIVVNPPYVTRIQVTGSVDDDLAVCVGGLPFVYTGTSSQAVNYDIQFNAGTCMWYAYTNNRNNGYRGDGLRAGVGYLFAGSERLTFTPANYGGGYSSNLTYTITYSDGAVVSKNVNGWYEAQLCNKVLYYTENENNSTYNYRNRVIGAVP